MRHAIAIYIVANMAWSIIVATYMAKAFRQLHKMDDISADDLDEDLSSDLIGEKQ
jgi:hypothetical protein